MPIRPVVPYLKGESKQKWQEEWQNITETAVTKSFFPNVQDRMKLRISVTPNITAMISHVKTKSYLHRFKMVDSPMCPCDSEEQSVDHILFSCRLLQKQRQILNKPTKVQQVNKFLKPLTNFINSIDFQKIVNYKTVKHIGHLVHNF